MKNPLKTPSLRLKALGVDAPILLLGCVELEDMILAVLRGWPVDRMRSEGGEEGSPEIVIRKADQGYRRTSLWSDGTDVFENPVDAVCDFLVDLMRAYIRDNPPLLCLHCAAVETKAGLVVFPSTYAAGKSTLAMHMAAAGAKLFADDVMPLQKEGGHGVASGILPRLRLPLCEETGTVLKPFLERRVALTSQRFAYYAMQGEELASHGETIPIAAMVLLERKGGAKAVLEDVGVAEMLKNTILRNFSQKVPGIQVLDRLNGLVGGVRRLRLTYSAAEQAVELLGQKFPFQGERRI